uniref:Uncharacterized protein n=1 Tax=Arundo donax TaxID=35708 RepID=A0A0A9GGJ6_ARUDO
MVTYHNFLRLINYVILSHWLTFLLAFDRVVVVNVKLGTDSMGSASFHLQV